MHDQGYSRIWAALPNLNAASSDSPAKRQRGDAFEVFVEAYLSIDKMAQVEEVWVVGKVPEKIRRCLNLPSRDVGYDGVFRTKAGELVLYQAKFRSARTPLSLPNWRPSSAYRKPRIVASS